MPRLNIMRDGKLKESIAIHQGQFLKIGSKPDNDIVLLDKQVSRYHAEIRSCGSGFKVVDTGSTNGVFVREKQIAEHVLEDGDEIKLGKVTIIFAKSDSSPFHSSSFATPSHASLSTHSVLVARQLSSFLSRSEPKSTSDMDERAAIDKSVKKLQQGLTDLEYAFEKLSTLYEVSQKINSSLDLKKVLAYIMDSVIKVAKADRGFIMLKNRNNEKLLPAIARGMTGELDKDERYQVSRTIARKSFEDRIPILTADAVSDERFKNEESVMGLSLRSVICVPLICHNKALGVIYLDNLQEKGTFSDDDLSFLQAFANQAAMALENATLHKEAIEKKKFERELELARQIQSNMLPRSCPILDEFSIGAACIPAKVVGGDYYDFLLHDIDKGRLGLLIADVSGKGVPAAIVLAMARSIIHTACSAGATPSSILSTLNRILSKDLNGSMFITVFLGFLDIRTGTLTYAKAGHNPPLILRADNTHEYLEAPGVPCGMFDDGKYPETAVELLPGDRLLLYTDGLTEACNEKGELFDNERLISSILMGRKLEASRQVRQMINDVINFRGQAPQNDDLTLLIVSRSKVESG